MAAAVAGAQSMSDGSVQVTYEDQQKINKFARKNSKLTDLKDEIESKKKALQNLEDASDELLMAEVDDLIPYQIGEVFINQSIDDTQLLIEAAKKRIQGEIEELEQESTDIKSLLSDLKIQLYAKFGKNINLEADEE